MHGVEGADLLEPGVDSKRILTEEDFARIKKLKRKAEELAKQPAARKTESKRIQGKMAGYALVRDDGEGMSEDEHGDNNGVEEDESEELEEEEGDDDGFQDDIDDSAEEGEEEEEEEQGAKQSQTSKEKSLVLDDFDNDDDDEDEEANLDPSYVDPVSLEGIRTRKRRALQDRLEQVKSERQQMIDAKSSRIVNNTEKAKRTKDFLMVQKSKSVHRKQTLSLRQQQVALKKHIKQLEVKSKLLTKVRKRG